MNARGGYDLSPETIQFVGIRDEGTRDPEGSHLLNARSVRPPLAMSRATVSIMNFWSFLFMCLTIFFSFAMRSAPCALRFSCRLSFWPLIRPDCFHRHLKRFGNCFPDPRCSSQSKNYLIHCGSRHANAFRNISLGEIRFDQHDFNFFMRGHVEPYSKITIICQ